jgi:hypothetical protein
MVRARAVLFLFNIIWTNVLRENWTAEFSHSLDPKRTWRKGLLALHRRRGRRPCRPSTAGSIGGSDNRSIGSQLPTIARQSHERLPQTSDAVLRTAARSKPKACLIATELPPWLPIRDSRRVCHRRSGAEWHRAGISGAHYLRSRLLPHEWRLPARRNNHLGS